MVEPVVQAAVITISSIVSRVVCEQGGKMLGWIDRKLDERTDAVIARAAERYLQNYRDRHGILKVLGMREPVDLEAVYTTVQFLDRADLRWYESVETLEKAYRRAGQRTFQPKDSARRDGLQVANEKQYLMVLGGPGAGKSTFLRRMGLEVLNGGLYQHECIPVLIELKNFSAGELSLEQAIVEEFRICGFPDSEITTAKLLQQGKLLVLLDGLDEVPTCNTDDTIRQIQNFVDRYDQNRFIASCRVAAYRHNFRRFSDVAMAEFDQAQIFQFIGNWFSSVTDQQMNTAQKCWELLQKPENAAAKELAQTPLLLTLLCLVYDRAQNFPTNRSSLYRKALRVLLEEWAAEKRILRDEIYQGLNTELEEILLSEIAYGGYAADRLFFQQRDLVTQIRAFLSMNLNAPKHLDGESVLSAIAIQQGILVERAEGIFSFSHLTLQEYLTAQYIDDHNLIKQLVAQHLTDERWQEVFLLVAGLMRSGVDELLLRMERRAQKLINTPRLQALLGWADAMTADSQTGLRPVARRAAALFFAVNRDRALDIVRIFHTELARALDLVRTLDLLRSPLSITAAELNCDLHRAVNLARSLNPAIAPARAQARNRALATPTSRTIAKAVTRALAAELQKNPVFADVNFTGLIARLETLKLRSPSTGNTPEMLEAFHERLSSTWFQALRLDADWVNLDATELQTLEHYLYIQWLMVRCRLAAVRVSPATWNALETRMLKGPEMI